MLLHIIITSLVLLPLSWASSPSAWIYDYTDKEEKNFAMEICSLGMEHSLSFTFRRPKMDPMFRRPKNDVTVESDYPADYEEIPQNLDALYAIRDGGQAALPLLKKGQSTAFKANSSLRGTVELSSTLHYSPDQRCKMFIRVVLLRGVITYKAVYREIELDHVMARSNHWFLFRGERIVTADLSSCADMDAFNKICEHRNVAKMPKATEIYKSGGVVSVGKDAGVLLKGNHRSIAVNWGYLEVQDADLSLLAFNHGHFHLINSTARVVSNRGVIVIDKNSQVSVTENQGRIVDIDQLREIMLIQKILFSK